MESFVRRLKYYGIGFGLGLVFLFFFFRNRGCSWLPENRVKNSILNRLIVISDETSAQLEKKGLTNDDVIEVLNDGDVVFSESDKRGDSKVYVIEKNSVKYCFTLPYESFVSEVKFGSDAKKVKTSTEGIGEIIRFPNDSTLVFPDSSSLITCQMNHLDLIRSADILKDLKASGRIDFGKTKLSVRPKPEHYLLFRRDTLELAADVIWYKNKLNIVNFHIPFETDCK